MDGCRPSGFAADNVGHRPLIRPAARLCRRRRRPDPPQDLRRNKVARIEHRALASPGQNRHSRTRLAADDTGAPRSDEAVAPRCRGGDLAETVSRHCAILTCRCCMIGRFHISSCARMTRWRRRSTTRSQSAAELAAAYDYQHAQRYGQRVSRATVTANRYKRPTAHGVRNRPRAEGIVGATPPDLSQGGDRIPNHRPRFFFRATRVAGIDGRPR